MALHVTPVASPSPMVPAARIGRPAAGNTTAGEPAAKVVPATRALQVTPSFDSMLESNSAAKRPAATSVTAAAKRPTAAATFTAASPVEVSANDTVATSSSAAAASGLSDFELLFGGSSYNPADPMDAAAAPSTSSASAVEAPPTAQSVFGAERMDDRPDRTQSRRLHFRVQPDLLRHRKHRPNRGANGRRHRELPKMCSPSRRATRSCSSSRTTWCKCPTARSSIPVWWRRSTPSVSRNRRSIPWIAQEVANTPTPAQTT